jgi:hypothetical protein
MDNIEQLILQQIQPAIEIEVVQGTNVLSIHIWGGIVKKRCLEAHPSGFRIRVPGAGLRILHIW